MRIFSRFALLSSLCMILLMGYAFQTQGATILYDNYSSGFVANPGNTILGGSNYQSIGQTFSPSQTANLSDIDAPFGYVSGTNIVILNLTTDNNGNPGTLLESWTLQSLPALSTNYSSQTMVSTINPLLTAGNTYWLIASPYDSSTWAVWNPTNNPNYGYYENSNSINPQWILVNDVHSSAFAVYGTPITPSQNTPEPGVLATLMSMGMAGGGIFLRRLRKA